MIPQEYIAELSRRVDITELIKSYVPLKRAGRMERGLCPFHNEKTPSFYVYPETNSYYCFGCGSGGDAITFVKQIQNLDYPEAVRFLAARVGMPLPEEDDETAKLRGRILSINRESARFYAGRLNTEEGKGARGYLRGRGLTDATIRHFGVGYAPDDFGRLRDHLKGMGFTEDELLEAWVCKRSQRGGLYDAFRNRIIFPIIDLRGNVIAFGGRQMAEGGPKYLNSGDTPVFKKSRGLFALNFAKKDSSGRFILAEGYMDVISLHQAGFASAVATLGTALTSEQAKLISNYADEVVICYDADEAGQRATARAIEIFKNTPVKVRVLNLPDAKDPDEYIQKYGPAAFERLLEGSGNTIEYALAKKKREFDLGTPDGRAAYSKAAIEILAAVPSSTERDIYAGRIAEETDVAKSALLADLDKEMRRRRGRMAKEREKRMRDEGLAAGINIPHSSGGAKALGVVFAEQQLVAALLKNPEDCIPMAEDALSTEQFISKEMAEAYDLILQLYRSGGEVELPMLTGILPEKTTALLGRVLALNYDVGFTREDVEMFIARIKKSRDGPEAVAGMSPEELQEHLNALRDRKS